MSKEKLTALDVDNKLVIRGDNIYRKMFIDENEGKIPETLWDDVSNAANASDEIKRIFGKIAFDTPKPSEYIQRMVSIATDENDIVMDFFSGSSTTADSVLKINHKDGKHRHFVMVQIPEIINDDNNICTIGKDRIRFVGKEFNDTNLDVGFRVYKLDSSNMTNVFFDPESFKQMNVEEFGNNVKPDRSFEDLLTQAMLELGIELSAKIETELIEDSPVSIVDDGYLVACLSDSCSESIIAALAKREIKSTYAVIRNGSGMTDQMLSNIEQIFKTYSPGTEVRLI